MLVKVDLCRTSMLYLIYKLSNIFDENLPLQTCDALKFNLRCSPHDDLPTRRQVSRRRYQRTNTHKRDSKRDRKSTAETITETPNSRDYLPKLLESITIYKSDHIMTSSKYVSQE